MTVKRYICTTHETFDQLAVKLKMETHQVRFGPFNMMKKNFDKYRRPWVGEIDTRGEYFKLFRTKGGDNTSDLSVHGRYGVRSGERMVEVQHKIHYSAFLGFGGLALFIVAVFFLMGQKGITVHPVLQTLAVICALLIYAYTFYRDLRVDEKMIRALIYAKYIVEDESEEDDDDD